MQSYARLATKCPTKVTGKPSSARIKPVLKELHWLPISYGVTYKVMLFSYKDLNNLGPAYLADRVSLYAPG